MQEVFEKIIEKIEEIKAKCLSCGDIVGCTDFKKAIEIVKQAAAENNNGWIPCSERLPEKSGYYIVTQERYSLDNKKLLSTEVDYRVQFDASLKKWYRAKHLRVIAWRVDLEPYQPKGE